MAKVINAKTFGQIQYTYTDSNGSQSVSDSDNTKFVSEYTYGTGQFNVNSIIKATGTLASGQTLQLDFNSYGFSSLGLTGVADFSSVKSILVLNTSVDSGIDLNICATGTGAAIGFFNGGSGNLVIKPYSCYVYNDPYGGVDVTSGTKLQIRNTASTSGSTSGNATYSITVMGIIPIASGVPGLPAEPI